MGRRNNQNRVYIGVDSDFLRCLAYIHYKKTSPEETDPKMETEMANSIMYKQHVITKNEYFTSMYNDIINDKYRIFISEPIYWENRHSKYLCNFMKDLCYMPQIDKLKKDFNCIKEIEELATAYTTARTEEFNGEEKYIRPAMNKQYIASIRKTVPSNDAYIMAWCTYFGCQLLTFNGKHFIYYVRGQQAYRRISIRNINQKLGYILEVVNDKTIVPAPYDCCETLVKYNRYTHSFDFDYSKNLDMFFEKASLVSEILDKKFNVENCITIEDDDEDENIEDLVEEDTEQDTEQSNYDQNENELKD